VFTACLVRENCVLLISFNYVFHYGFLHTRSSFLAVVLEEAIVWEEDAAVSYFGLEICEV
jgi:hypothetical protein